MNFSIYDEHGMFIAKLSCPSVHDAERTTSLMGAKGFVSGTYDPDVYWLDQSTQTVLQRLPMEVHQDGLRLSGVPAGAMVSVQGDHHVADGTDIELSFSQPGRYQVKVSLPPRLPFETSIDYENSP